MAALMSVTRPPSFAAPIPAHKASWVTRHSSAASAVAGWPTKTLRAASPCQPSTMAPQSIETRSPSRNTRSPGIPCTTSSFTETQITPGKPPSPCSSP